MRGKQSNTKGDGTRLGITPADAGKTLVEAGVNLVKGDHPRGCGENRCGVRQISVCRGSPPRMRGKLKQKWKKETDTGITPADAGKTSGAGSSRQLSRDHPRGCGENIYAVRARREQTGSPPRMRGKHENLFANSHDSRITPADAGKTTMKIKRGDEQKDHPRGCGENRCIRKVSAKGEGSPPRMRGKPEGGSSVSEKSGITPADAGKTSKKERILNDFEDHPRGCGENFVFVFGRQYNIGSPPRMRGKLTR